VAVVDRSRSVLPIPERRHVGLTTYDAKDPDTSFPPIVVQLDIGDDSHDHLITPEDRLRAAMVRQ
jgi:hypothetical protein